jgi:transposase
MRMSVNREHGPHRCPVGDARTAVSTSAPGRWARSTVAGHASGAERGLLGLTHRRSLARSAASLSALPNLSSALPTVAAFRVAHATAPETGGRFTRPRKAGSERVVHRCQLQRGEKRGSAVGPTRRGKGSKIMAISDGHGLPLAVHVASASPHETKLVAPTLEQRFLAEAPERLIGDRAYDSDPLDVQIRERFGVQLVAPHHPTRSKAPTQDGRVLRRYRRRWKIERLFAWLHNFRRVVIRWEYYPENFLGMVQLACAVILLRYL